MKVYDTHDKATLKIYTDQTGRFPKKSSCGNQYVMVLAKININAILIEPMKNRTSGKMIRAYKTFITRLAKALIFSPNCTSLTMNAHKTSITQSNQRV
jgi:hypothetical protein